MANEHINFWLALLKYGSTAEQQSRYWNGYLAWKLPEDVSYAIRNEGNPPFNRFFVENPCALNDKERCELDVIAAGNGGHPLYEQQSAGAEASWYMDFSARDYHNISLRNRLLIGVNFSKTTLKGEIDFTGATFIRPSYFEGATFEDRSRFDKATFANTVYFKDAKFEGSAVFDGSMFKDGAYFQNATFPLKLGAGEESFGGVRFTDATFQGEASFEGATFGDHVRFDGTTFLDSADLKCAEVGNDTDFQRAMFKSRTDFQYATFERPVIFNDASFEAVTSFSRTVFKRPPKFFGNPAP